MATQNPPQISSEEYKEVLKTAFVQCYQTSNDAWSYEEAMREVPVYFLECIGSQKGHILDIGAGSGKDAEILLKAGHSVTGLDLYEHEAWQFLSYTWGDRINFVKSQFTDWQPSPETKFDAVFDNGCFHHQHPSLYFPYLTHLKTLLKPNGIAMLSVFTPLDENTDGSFIDFDEGRIGRSFSVNELQQLLTNHGFIWLDSRRIYRPWHEHYLPVHYLAALVKNQP
ncbi:class I SAM-dependent methyltransferase [Nostoc linckia]|uniref:class I SAM-dependent methyltransferase n=1 Tax=Nostoc linckia TaxID=92942 RepID=UPI000BFFF87B|nr:class I SAM-dependent methyltransferase [Nostoc linckia]